MANAGDLKSPAGNGTAGSSPALGTADDLSSVGRRACTRPKQVGVIDARHRPIAATTGLMRRSSGLGLWVAWMALGCGDGTAPHDRELSAAGERGGIRSPCDGEPIATPVAWDEQTALAISAREAFASTAGRCEAPLSWDASGAGVALEPASGEAGLGGVPVEIDGTAEIDPADEGEAVFVAERRDIDGAVVRRFPCAGDGVRRWHRIAGKIEIVRRAGAIGRHGLAFVSK